MKKFFEKFDLLKPMIKKVNWYGGPDAHADDWYYSYAYLCEEKIDMTVEDVNKRIEECKKKKPEDIKHGGFCFDRGCYVEAFYDEPILTDEIYLKLLSNLEIEFNHTPVEEIKTRILKESLTLSIDVVKDIFKDCDYKHRMRR